MRNNTNIKLDAFKVSLGKSGIPDNQVKKIMNAARMLTSKNVIVKTEKKIQEGKKMVLEARRRKPTDKVRNRRMRKVTRGDGKKVYRPRPERNRNEGTRSRRVMDDPRVVRRVEHKPDENVIVTVDDGKGVITEVSKVNVIPQKKVVEIPCRMKPDALIAVAFCWPLYAMANDILIDEMINVGVNSVGKLWLAAATIGFDLYCAAGGAFSIFANAPQAYWDLRDAILPTTYAGNKYSFNNVDGDFMGGFLGNFPLVSDFVSLSWPVATGALDGLETVPPILVDTDFVDYGVNIVADLWTNLHTSQGKHKMVERGNDSAYVNRPEVYAATRIFAVAAENTRWSTFCSEFKPMPKAGWLMRLGLVDGEVSERGGPFIETDYSSSSYYMHRLIEEFTGLVPKYVLRFNYISIEEIVNSITATLLTGDLQYNGVAGTNSINQSALQKSVFYNVGAGSYLVGIIQCILRRFQMTTCVAFDNPTLDTYVLTGRCWHTSVLAGADRVPAILGETFSSLQRLKISFREGAWNKVIYPVLVAHGTFGNNGYAPSNQQIELLPLLGAIQPGTNPISYKFHVETFNLPLVIDPSVTSLAYTSGTNVATGEQCVNEMMSALVGNVSTRVADSALDKTVTLMRYTRLLERSQQYGPFRRGTVKTKEIIIENDEVKTIENAPWSPIYGSNIDYFMCDSEFSINDVAHDFVRVLPTSFLTLPLFKAIYGMDYNIRPDSYSDDGLLDYAVKMAMFAAHPIGSSDMTDETQSIDEVSTRMGVGGGFIDVIGKIFSSIFG